jgi:hypothetical protein
MQIYSHGDQFQKEWRPLLLVKWAILGVRYWDEAVIIEKRTYMYWV